MNVSKSFSSRIRNFEIKSSADCMLIVLLAKVEASNNKNKNQNFFQSTTTTMDINLVVSHLSHYPK